MPLTDTAARNAKFEGKRLKLSDERGLYLWVTQSGKYWCLKYRIGGKEKKLHIGTYPEVTLKSARQKRDEARQLVADGIDPNTAKQDAKKEIAMVEQNSLATVAAEWFAAASGRWKPSHADGVWRSLEKDLLPTLGHVAVDAITPPQLLELLRGIEDRGSLETAGRIHQRVGAIMRFAIAAGKATSNPVRDLAGALTTAKPKHHPALPAAELPEFFRRLVAEPLDPITKLGFRFMLLTMTRPGEVRHAEWAEIDLDAGLWRLPAEKMKMARDHLVPLTRQALDVLAELRKHTGSREHLFPNATRLGGVMSENTFSRAMKRMGYQGIAVPHGFRSVASTLLNEAGFSSDWIELQLAHVEGNASRRAYNRAEHLDGRRQMLQWLADYYEQAETGGNVVPVNFTRSA